MWSYKMVLFPMLTASLNIHDQVKFMSPNLFFHFEWYKNVMPSPPSIIENIQAFSLLIFWGSKNSQDKTFVLESFQKIQN